MEPMTFSGVFTKISNRLTEFKIKDVFGGTLDGSMCFGLLEKSSNGEWGKIVDQLRDDEINLDEFESKATAMLDELERELFRRKVEKKIM